MKRLLRHASLAVTLFATVVSVIARSVMAGDHRIRTVLYDPGQVYRLHGWVGYHIDIQFELGESFQSLAGGDLGALTHGEFENHLVIKPTAENIRTNLTIYTSRRTYVFDYVVDAGAPDPAADDLVYSVRFTYPTPNEALGNAKADAVAEGLKDAPNTRIQNYNYLFCGDASLQPLEASDDGVHTRLRFGPRAEIPAFFVRSDDDTESLLNFSVDPANGDVVIHRTARRLILRRGKLVGCIVNRSYTGAGERLPSGTISPDVRRDAPAVRP